MRAPICIAVISLISTAAFAASDRWALSYDQGTMEAIVSNRHGASLNIYCPSGQAAHVPGMFIEAAGLRPKAGEKVDVQIVVDGKNNAFSFDEVQFVAAEPAGLKDLDLLIDELAKSKSSSFIMNVPKFSVSESLSTAGARKALKSARSFLDGCQ